MALPGPKEEDEAIWECGVPKPPCTGFSPAMGAEQFPPPGKLGPYPSWTAPRGGLQSLAGGLETLSVVHAALWWFHVVRA